MASTLLARAQDQFDRGNPTTATHLVQVAAVHAKLAKNALLAHAHIAAYSPRAGAAIGAQWNRVAGLTESEITQSSRVRQP